MPFFKKDTNQLLTSSYLEGPAYILTEETKDNYVYPIDGWCWFSDLDTAISNINNVTTDKILVVSMRRAQIALYEAGLLDIIEQAVATNRVWKIQWEKATEIDRRNPFFAELSSMLGLTEETIDSLFNRANSIP